MPQICVKTTLRCGTCHCGRTQIDQLRDPHDHRARLGGGIDRCPGRVPTVRPERLLRRLPPTRRPAWRWWWWWPADELNPHRVRRRPRPGGRGPCRFRAIALRIGRGTESVEARASVSYGCSDATASESGRGHGFLLLSPRWERTGGAVSLSGPGRRTMGPTAAHRIARRSVGDLERGPVLRRCSVPIPGLHTSRRTMV